MFNDKVIAVTGGTGSFGKAFVRRILESYSPKKVIVFSRDEFKQYEMSRLFNDPRLRFFIGDVRDKDRLYRAFYGVDYIVHAAAFKQVVAAEYNPFEAVKTNIIGGQNVIEAAIDNKVRGVIALSTDKAANPINLYGAAKLASDKLFIAGNSYAGGRGSKFAVVRYGNVLGSRGSILPLFLEQKLKGELTITEPAMTRFWIELDKAVELVFLAFNTMHGGELYIPKIPSLRMDKFANILAPEAKITIVGIRPGEKLHETMIPCDEARNTLEFDDHYRILPAFLWDKKSALADGGSPVRDDFCYSSGDNPLELEADRLLSVAVNVAKELNIPFTPPKR
ncbi:MAG: UDP-N-acetylglucosamine 4,6-dehydratase (inverting) [Deferribacteraceae bacterium]|jgi:UDP-N-acetylglucosamine 4,6-dehydratase|nr:UDP-N-acetylglucosamine 4,6-dehydratase (inverting) [Deferribacteraceae bacterium]